MKKEFVLTVTVTGDSLQDVDNGLIEAAGERLKARISENASKAIEAQTTPKGFKVTMQDSVRVK